MESHFRYEERQLLTVLETWRWMPRPRRCWGRCDQASKGSDQRLPARAVRVVAGEDVVGAGGDVEPEVVHAG